MSHFWEDTDWTLTGNKAAIRGGKKCSLQNFFPLFSFLRGKMCKLADAESEQQKILFPLTSLGEWEMTGQTPVCSPGLLEDWCAALCHRRGNPPKSCMSDHLTRSVLLIEVCVKSNCLKKGVRANGSIAPPGRSPLTAFIFLCFTKNGQGKRER